MTNSSYNPAIRDGDEIENEWSKLSYDFWCRKQAQAQRIFKEKRVVDLYELVRSVIEKDLTETEQLATKLHWYDGLSVEKTAERLGLSRQAVYRALNKSKEKIQLVVKHVMNCEIYATETDDWI